MVSLWAMISTTLIIGTCVPIEMTFELDRTGAKCLNFRLLFIGMNSVDVVLCLTTLLTPVWWIWNLQLTKAKKIQISIALLLGGG